MTIINGEVIVAGPEEAADGVAEFWAGGQQLGRTLLPDERALLQIDPRAGAQARTVDTFASVSRSRQHARS